MRRIETTFKQSAWTIGLTAALLLPASSVLAGGSSYSGPSASVADQEILRRLERIERAKEAEIEADRLMRDDNYEGAVAKYQEALAGIPNAPMSAGDRGRIIIKYINAACLQADRLGKQGRMEEGKTLCKGLLADDIDPDNARARELIKRLDDPDYYNPSNTKAHYEDTEKVNMHLKKGLGYFDLGQYKEAEAEFNNILQIDPHNTAARRLLEKT